MEISRLNGCWNFMHLVFQVCVLFFIYNSSISAQNVTTDTKYGTSEPVLLGYRIEDKDAIVEYETNGALVIAPEKYVRFLLIGLNLKSVRRVELTESPDKCGANTTNTVIVELPNGNDDDNRLIFTSQLPHDQRTYYTCLCNNNDNKTNCKHQGASPDYKILKSRVPEKITYLPIPLQIIIICVLLVLSGLFSGLNLGLMSLDKTELKIILKVGDSRERDFAKKIYPIRKSGNYLLCTLLLGNVVVNSGISILFDDLTTGYIALIVASLGIVVFGEILPQAICSRYGLAVGAYTVFITRFFMVFTFPLSWPISKLLDKLLGEEVGQVYNRERLLELIRVSKDQGEGDLQNCQEVQIVTGALELSKKTVGDVMTHIINVFMLPSDLILDPKNVSEIVKSGFTRIPVHEAGNRNNVVYMLNVKDLALLDPEDQIPLTTICQFYQHPVRFVMEDTPLSVMLEEFKKGHYHLAIVQRINAEGEGDPVYEAVGLITLEDIIEEIIQAEIRDEFDIIRDSRINRMRQRRRGTMMNVVGPADVTIFFNQNMDACDVSPQLTLATYQYLSTSLDAFRASFVSENVLHRLIRQNVVRTKPAEAYENAVKIFQKGKETDFFVLILEGKCTVTVGESNMVFEAGPFHYFGYELLTKITNDLCRRDSVLSLNNGPSSSPAPAVDSTRKKFTFTPDFQLQIGQQDLIYLKITSSVYLKAYRATLIERGGGRLGSGLAPISAKDQCDSVLNSPEGGSLVQQNTGSMQLSNFIMGGSGGGQQNQNRSRSLSEECKALLTSNKQQKVAADANSVCSGDLKSDTAVIVEESPVAKFP